MNRSCVSLVIAIAVVLFVVAAPVLSAQKALTAGKVIQRTELNAAPGVEALLVLRPLPPGAQSGKHTQSGNEIVYILDGSITLEREGKPPLTVNKGEAFTTSAGEVHNVKNASSTAPATALAFYVANKGARLEDLAVPTK